MKKLTVISLADIRDLNSQPSAQEPEVLLLEVSVVCVEPHWVLTSVLIVTRVDI